jgi:hypothetical protein
MGSGTLSATFTDNQQVQQTWNFSTGAVTLPAPGDPIVGTWSLSKENGVLVSLPRTENLTFTSNGLYSYTGSDSAGVPYLGNGHWNLMTANNYMIGDYTFGGNFIAVLSDSNQTMTVNAMTTPPDSWEYQRVP